MQTTGLIDRVKHVIRRTANRITGSQAVPVSRGPSALESLGERPLITPPVDVFENEQEIMICADVPGARTDNTEIHWDERSGLSLYVWLPGSHMSGRNLRSEFHEEHDWYRVFQTPDYVDVDRAESEITMGVLTVRLPKRAPARPKQIRIMETQ